MIKVVINADDYGLSDGICRAIIELLDSGAISNTTIMIAAPDARRRSERWGIFRLKGVAGVHLQLSDGKPISPAKDVPSLVDPTSGEFLPRQLAEQFNRDEVALEWERQLQAVTELLGEAPTHLDSHKGVHRLKMFSDIYLSLASKYKLPVRGGIETEFSQMMQDANVRGSTILLREWTGHSAGLDPLKETLAISSNHIKNNDIIEIVTHPGYNDRYLESISSLNEARETDRSNLVLLREENWLANNGFRLVKYPHL